jgi:hypothetical protein
MTPKKKKRKRTKKVAKRKQSHKRKAPAKKRAPARKNAPPKKRDQRRKSSAQKKASSIKLLKTRPPKLTSARGTSENASTVPFEQEGLGSNSAGQSGDLQGLSNIAGADSESVNELIEEGNAYEAAVIEGVEHAPDADRGEVRTREVPEDDVPEEYLDSEKDK